ncbi:MAG: leucine-rich repeat domain-containing protein [Lachnospiraceae bacterium]|nr:leucine-rich repeat domain-containing protein [Lachnospiraceae bacterium]
MGFMKSFYAKGLAFMLALTVAVTFTPLPASAADGGQTSGNNAGDTLDPSSGSDPASGGSIASSSSGISTSSGVSTTSGVSSSSGITSPSGVTTPSVIPTKPSVDPGQGTGGETHEEKPHGLFEIPEGTASIADNEYKGTGYQEIIMADSVQTIGEHAFEGGVNLNNVYFKDAPFLTTIGAYAFANNPNLGISLPSSVTKIGPYAFANCPNLRDSAPKKYDQDQQKRNDPSNQAGVLENTQITEVPEYCFFQSENVHISTLPATVVTIGAFAYSGVKNIDTVNFLGSSLKSIGEGVFKDAPNLHRITIPEGVTTIPKDAFSGCVNLNEIVLPNTVTTIDEHAFKDCKNIHHMVIPASVKYIASNSFEGVTNINEIDFSQNPYAASILKGTPYSAATKGTVFVNSKYRYRVLADTDSTSTNGSVDIMGFKNNKLKNRTTVAIIPSTVTFNGITFKVQEIDQKAFMKCKRLKKAVIGNNVQVIGKSAFFKCRMLKVVQIKSLKIKSVGKYAFAGTKAKVRVKVPKKRLKKYRKLLRGKGRLAVKR